MIHPYLRAVGFSEYTDRKQLNTLLLSIIKEPSFSTSVKRDNGIKLGFFSKEYAPACGITVCGEYDENDNFLFEYYYPYLKGSAVSTDEEISLERATMLEAFEGIVDESRVGVSLIFFVMNMADCIQMGKEPGKSLAHSNLKLSAFAENGVILLPIAKTKQDKELTLKKNLKRLNMIMDAKRGNEGAIENLTLDEMDTYTTVSKKIKNSDIFTLVDTYFMPNGVECDHYSILGEIRQVDYLENQETKERVVKMQLLCNGLLLDVCLNEKDLKGEPVPGRRFRGNIWMQGCISFAGDSLA